MWKIEKIVKKGDYNYTVVKGHPNATKHGYVLEHRVVVENDLGRLLNPNEVVHHVNGDKKDNRLENLQVMGVKEHSSLHGHEIGEVWAELKCPQCKSTFHRPRNQTFLSKGSKLNCTCCSETCRGKFSRHVQLNGRTPEVEYAISENILSLYVRYKYKEDNAEQTVTTGCVETIRVPPEMVKT